MIKLAVIGLGYVGLPLALEFSKKNYVIAFDINKNRIKKLKRGSDYTDEIKNKKLLKNKKLFLTSNPNHLKNANTYIIAVPTPINNNKKPDLSIILSATKVVAKYINNQDVIIYESTVFLLKIYLLMLNMLVPHQLLA